MLQGQPKQVTKCLIKTLPKQPELSLSFPTMRDDVPVPREIPSKGPCYGTDKQDCRIGEYYWRPRLTGPKHSVLVIRCATHKKPFTIYPAGFVPYQRLPMANTAYATSHLENNQGEHPLEAFQDTQFQAAVDASEGEAWPREWREGPRKWWETQRRRIAKMLVLLGLDPEMEETKRIQVTQLLNVEHMLVLEQKRAIEDKPGYRCRGHGVASMLKALMKSGKPVERLLLAGHQVGLWGMPLWWDADSGIIRKIPFRLARHENPV